MSDYQDQSLQYKKDSMSSKLNICLFSSHPKFSQSLIELLNDELYETQCFSLVDELVDFVTQEKEHLDCILLVNNTQISSIFTRLWQGEILLPTVIIESQSPVRIIETKPFLESLTDFSAVNILYHQAEIHLYLTQLKEIKSYINLAIAKFLHLVPDLENSFLPKCDLKPTNSVKNSLVTQQHRLTDKIKERLGYLGFFYKRNSSDFYENLDLEGQKELYQKLMLDYEKILLSYFKEESQINQLIDRFIDRAFFANISTSQILEIHMELIDNFAYQLQLEGRKDDILLDYRLTLIDITAHLCEMYRRSIPGDDISWELLFGVEKK